MTGIENLSEKSLLDIHESLRTSGMFDMENIADCEKLLSSMKAKTFLEIWISLLQFRTIISLVYL